MVSIDPDPRPHHEGLRLACFAEVRLAVVGFALLPAATIAHRTGVGVRASEVAFAVVVVLSALGLPTLHAAGLGLTAWAMLTGFVVNDLGQLSFAASDLARLASLVAVAVAAALLGRGGPTWSSRRPVRMPSPQRLGPMGPAFQASRRASSAPRARPDR